MMPEQQSNERDLPSSRTVQIKGIVEKWKTIRLLIICITVLGGLYLFLDAITQILDQPPWLAAVLALIGGIFGPSAVAWKLKVGIRRYTETEHQRLIDLEKKLDPNRSTSGLTEKGETPEELP